MLSRLRAQSVLLLSLLGAVPFPAPAGERCWPTNIRVTTAPVPPQAASSLFRHEQIEQKLDGMDADLVLLGDSLLAGWKADALQKAFPGRKILNLAIGGDRTQNVLWRLSRLDLSKIAPNDVVVLIGTNNLFANDLPCAIAAGAEAVLQRLRSIWPRAQIMLIGVPPIGANFNFKAPARRELNALLAGLSKPAGALYISLDEPISCGFQSPCGTYLSDGIHFSEEGYRVIGNILGAALKEKH